jgi:hypothetical protein
MSYVHCARCRRAFDVAARAACPACAWSPGGARTLDVRITDALTALEAALAAAPARDQARLAGVVRARLAGLFAEPEPPVALARADAALVRTDAEDPRLRAQAAMVLGAIVMTIAARLAEAMTAARPAARPLGLARRVWSRLR